MVDVALWFLHEYNFVIHEIEIVFPVMLSQYRVIFNNARIIYLQDFLADLKIS